MGTAPNRLISCHSRGRVLLRLGMLGKLPMLSIASGHPWRVLAGEAAHAEEAILYALIMASASCSWYTCSSTCFGFLLH